MRDINIERVNNELNDYYGYKIELIIAISLLAAIFTWKMEKECRFL